MLRAVRRRAGAVACVLALAAAGAPGASAQERPVRPRTTYEDLQMFSQVLNQILVNHPDTVDTHELFMAAVEGMVRAVDPHSYVLPAARLSPERTQAMREGRLVPVPIRFAYIGGAAVVVAVEPASEAATLGILPGDELIAADSVPITAASADELDVVLAGEGGSDVVLRFERVRIDGSRVELERVVRREEPGEESAIGTVQVLPGSIGYVRVLTFASERAADELHDALGALEEVGIDGLVLDLRDNGGGIVDEAARVAGEFLPRGLVVYTMEGRKPELNDTGLVTRSMFSDERRYPIVVLVNRGTASASELVAGALQDHDRALIVGQPTFGKALVMQGFPLTDGSVMMLVVGRLRTPCGRVIQREYRSVTTREYYRATAEERELADRPSCRTRGGRTVYGGGGIYPDVVLPEESVPMWLAHAREQDLLLRWIGGFVDAHAAEFTTPEALSVDDALTAEAERTFREFAARQGVAIPADAGDRLRALLLRVVARTRWGTAGYYDVAVELDPEVRAAAAQMDAARAILPEDD